MLEGGWYRQVKTAKVGISADYRLTYSGILGGCVASGVYVWYPRKYRIGGVVGGERGDEMAG
eukprot:466900-Prorocentrum_minimum.AAC.1